MVILVYTLKKFTLRNYGKVLYGMVMHNTYTHSECIIIFKMLQLTIQGLLSIQAYEEAAKEIQKQYEKAVTNRSWIFELMDATYEKRRQWLSSDMPLIHEVLSKFPVLRKPRYVSH